MSHADRFCTPPGPYLLSHSVGLQPVTALEHATHTYFDGWSDDPEHVWDAWLAAADGFRGALAVLLDHQPASFCPQQNVTSGLSKILQAVPRRSARTKIVLTEDAFPSLGFAIARSGYAVEFIPRDLDATDPATWSSALTDDVAIVLITHAHSNTGELMPVRRIVEMADQQDIISIVDIAQSVGIIPIDLAAWNATFVLGSCVKWLCGGPGAGFLWARPDVIDRCTPTDTGWFSHADPFEFDIHHFADAPDALRFWGGTPTVLPLTVAGHSIGLATEIGIDEIRRHNLALTDRIIDALPAAMIASPVDPDRRNGTVVLATGDDTDAVATRLSHAKIAVDRRATGWRISPHIYTSDADIDTLLDQIRH